MIAGAAGSKIGQPRNEVPRDSPLLAAFPWPAAKGPATRLQDLRAVAGHPNHPSLLAFKFPRAHREIT